MIGSMIVYTNVPKPYDMPFHLMVIAVTAIDLSRVSPSVYKEDI